MQRFQNTAIAFFSLLTALLVVLANGQYLRSQRSCSCTCSHPRYDICDTIASVESRIDSSDEALRRYIRDFQRFRSFLNEEITDLVNDLVAKYLESNLKKIIVEAKLLGNSDNETKGVKNATDEINCTRSCADEPPPVANGRPIYYERTPGSTVLYACDENYAMTGNSTVQCLYGKWAGYPPICVQKNCAAEPPGIENGKPAEFEREPGSEVRYVCDENYSLAGKSSVKCQSGKWEGHPPVCVEQSCACEPPSVANGKPADFKRSSGSVVQYMCDENYVLTGYSSVYCRFGSWEGHPPVCVENGCIGEPPSVENGTPIELKGTFGAEIQYVCDDNYTLAGKSTVRCLFGKWEGHPPICIEQICDCEPPSIENGKHTDFKRTPLSEVQYTCDENYILSGNSSVRCRFGKWEGLPPVCVEKSCAGEPPVIENGKPTDFERQPGSEVRYVCDENFILTGNTTIRCRLGNWEGFPPLCVERSCDGEPPTIENGKATEFGRKPGSEVLYVCDENFILTEETKIRCRFGQWKGLPPLCAEKSCTGEPPAIENGKPLEFERTPGSEIRYACDENFKLAGNSNVRCRFGTWEGNPPVCLPSYFDPGFTLTTLKSIQATIDCYSGEKFEKKNFSLALNTGQGSRLPAGYGVDSDRHLMRGNLPYFGAFQCEFEKQHGIMKIIFLKAGFTGNSRIQAELLASRDYQVANIGDTVQLEVNILKQEQLPIKWRYNEKYVPSWDGQRRIELRNVQPENTGIYECFYEGRRNLGVHALMRVIVRKCLQNLYGKDCSQNCPPCYNGGICHDALGICICPAAFSGTNCEVACGRNRFGGYCSRSYHRSESSDWCNSRIFCRPDPYGCSCATGCTGFKCDRACEPGWYGEDCKQPCHCVDGPNSCDRYTGACKNGCSTGWKGDSCQIEDVG